MTATRDSYDVQLRSALAEADLRVVLMCLVHATGDMRWLEEPFTPVRDVRLIAPPDAGLPPDVQAEIREAAFRAFAGGSLDLAIDDPGPDLMLRMMSVCLGEQVPVEYVGMMREDLGFVQRVADLARRATAEPVRREVSVIIVGAGVSGLALAAYLDMLGVDCVIVEKNEEIGGTWWENTYPGCGVDTPNHAYSFSVGAPYPWTRYFAHRSEIHDYLLGFAHDFKIRDRVRFSTEVVGAVWDEDQFEWTVDIRSGDGVATQERAAVLVSATGLLNVPSVPPLQGIDDYQGELFHSSRWPEGLDLAGRHVSVVGTGATSMQIVPAIVDTAETLTIYQRTPQWARPIEGYGSEIPAGSRWLLETVPNYARWVRFTMAWRYGDGLLRHLRRDPLWHHPERSVNRTNERHRQEMVEFIQRELADRPDLIDICIPSYPPFGKRILLDNDWYKTIKRPNVQLVTDPISHFERSSICTSRGDSRPADVVVMATGFKVTELAARLNIQGRGGVTLREAWSGDNPTAHLGMSVPGFPNMFCMIGPNSALGHGGSLIFQSECQARYIAACVLEMRTQGLRSIEIRKEVHDDWVRRVDAEHEQLIWTHPQTSTWFKNSHGRIVAVMPWRLVDYWQMTHDPNLDEFEIC